MSAEGMTATVLATELDSARRADEGLLFPGPAVSAWLRSVAAELCRTQTSGLATNRDGTVGVDRDYHWLPMSSCPRGVKLQLKGKSGVALYAKYDGKDDWWVGWAPLPTEKRDGTT